MDTIWVKGEANQDRNIKKDTSIILNIDLEESKKPYTELFIKC